MPSKQLPHTVSAAMVFGLIVSTGALAAGAVVTSVDTLVPLIERESWAEARALSERTRALHVEVSVADGSGFDDANRDSDSSDLCISGELAVEDFRIEVHERGSSYSSPGPLISAGNTDERGTITFDLKPGRYVLIAAEESSSRHITMDTDKMALYEMAFRRSVPVPSANETDNSTSMRFSYSRGGEWVLFDRAMIGQQESAHGVRLSVFRQAPSPDVATNFTARFERIGDDAQPPIAWTERWHDQQTWDVRLVEGSYRLNITWDDGKSAETTFDVDQRLFIRTVWAGAEPSLVVDRRYPACA